MAMLLSTVVVAQQKVINFYKEGFFQIPLVWRNSSPTEQGKQSNSILNIYQQHIQKRESIPGFSFLKEGRIYTMEKQEQLQKEVNEKLVIACSEGYLCCKEDIKCAMTLHIFPSGRESFVRCGC
ncbi:hypothetical protein [Bacillus paramycoides]|uniref:hypothetical protein n=1 Tax=Bacillus paramycoides TaxID=2026194 RepID=UPI002E1DDC69|nr:hypothetical protein [Bacillus paramycoides]